MAILGSNTLNHSGDLFIQRAGVTRIQLIDGAALFTSANTGMANAAGRLTNLEVIGTGGAAFMSFHRPGAYAGYFGMDTDNQFRIGGWSLGGVSYPIIHTANIFSWMGTNTAGNLGAYQLARSPSITYALNSLAAGSDLQTAGFTGTSTQWGNPAFGGTWRHMGGPNNGNTNASFGGMFMRAA
jgi:hypothetical protein